MTRIHPKKYRVQTAAVKATAFIAAALLLLGAAGGCRHYNGTPLTAKPMASASLQDSDVYEYLYTDEQLTTTMQAATKTVPTEAELTTFLKLISESTIREVPLDELDKLSISMPAFEILEALGSTFCIDETNAYYFVIDGQNRWLYQVRVEGVRTDIAYRYRLNFPPKMLNLGVPYFYVLLNDYPFTLPSESDVKGFIDSVTDTSVRTLPALQLFVEAVDTSVPFIKLTYLVKKGSAYEVGKMTLKKTGAVWAITYSNYLPFLEKYK